MKNGKSRKIHKKTFQQKKSFNFIKDDEKNVVFSLTRTLTLN